MTYPGNPQGSPNQGYGYSDTYPPPQQSPAAGGEGSYSLDPLVPAPTYQPIALNPGPPISSPPTSGFPGSPAGYPVTGPPDKRGVTVPLLAAFLALAVIAAGVFVGLWVDKSNKFDATETMSNQRQAALDQSGKDLEQTRTDLKARADELTKTQQDLRGAETDRTEFKRQRDVMGTCLKLLIEALDAVESGDQTTAQNKINEMKQPCNEAEVILGI